MKKIILIASGLFSVGSCLTAFAGDLPPVMFYNVSVSAESGAGDTEQLACDAAVKSARETLSIQCEAVGANLLQTSEPKCSPDKSWIWYSKQYHQAASMDGTCVNREVVNNYAAKAEDDRSIKSVAPAPHRVIPTRPAHTASLMPTKHKAE